MTATNTGCPPGALLPCAWPVREDAAVPLSIKAQSAQAMQLSTEKNRTRAHSPGAVGSCLTAVTLQLCYIAGTPGIIASIRQSTWTFPGKSRSRSSTSHWPVSHFPPLLSSSDDRKEMSHRFLSQGSLIPSATSHLLSIQTDPVAPGPAFPQRSVCVTLVTLSQALPFTATELQS